LGDYNESVEVAANGIRWRGRYTGGDPLVKKLAWSVSAAPSPDRRRLEFTSQVNWDTCSKRLRVVVPVASTADSATYEVPFGFVERKFDPAALNYSQWQGNDMTWPTLHWANARLDERRGVAVLNRGLPGYRWMSGRFDVSLLRSPQWQFCSVETGSYEFWDIDGQRDAGKHTLEYAIWPYTDGVTEGDLTRGGYEYNMLSPIRLPFGLEGDVVVTAWKPAQDGQGWIVRLQEAAGRDGGQVGLLLGKARTVTVTDLLERPLELPTSTGHFQRSLHKHEILTVRIA
jgi:alpha-mannosidase